jgi:tetratricopeptide (TPR) repeat protein
MTQEDDDIPAHIQAIINQAKAPEARYEQGEGVPALDDAIAAWERILNHPDFADAEGKLRLGVLNDSAITYRRRYRATAVLADLDKALSYWEELVNSMSRDSPDLPDILTNLSTGLSYRYQRRGDLSYLNGCIVKALRAVTLTPEGSPDLPNRLSNLGNRLSNRYERTGDLSDLDDSIAAFKNAAQFGSSS